MKLTLVIVALSAASSSAQRCSGPGTGDSLSIARLLPGIFGQVLGDVNVEEPEYEVLLDRKDRAVPYEVREYGTRWTVGTDMRSSDDTSAFQWVLHFQYQIQLDHTNSFQAFGGLHRGVPDAAEREGDEDRDDGPGVRQAQVRVGRRQRQRDGLLPALGHGPEGQDTQSQL